MDYPQQQFFPQQNFQQQQQQMQAPSQVQFMMQQQQQQQQQQQYPQSTNQNENYYLQASRSYAYTQGVASNSNASNLQQYQINNEPRHSAVTPPEKPASITTHFTSDQYNYLVPSLPPLNPMGVTPPHSAQHSSQHSFDTSPLTSNYVPDSAHFGASLLEASRQQQQQQQGIPPPPKKGRKRRHTATVHDMTPETAERNRCRICNKQFKRPSSLRTHVYSHTGEKLFQCPWDGCGKLFSVKSNMTRHYRLHERDMRRAQERELEARQQQQQQQGIVSHGVPAPILPPSSIQQQQQQVPVPPQAQPTLSHTDEQRSQYPTYLSSTSNMSMNGSDSTQ
ncbi:mtfA C2H2 finger domain transcription factor mtfA [Candida maltosa Xu316]